MPFQSTHPARGATFNLGHNFGLLYVISIHAPREGCDPTAGRGRYLRDNFNPRTPRGVRPLTRFNLHFVITISIHAPREGCDRPPRPSPRISADFNPRTPRGVRPRRTGPAIPGDEISIHAPREGCDAAGRRGGRRRITISIHAPREGCDLTASAVASPAAEFQSTHPARGATHRSSGRLPAGLNFNPRTPRGVRQKRSVAGCLCPF